MKQIKGRVGISIHFGGETKMKIKLKKSVKFRSPELSPELRDPLGGPEKAGGVLNRKTKKNKKIAKKTNPNKN